MFFHCLVKGQEGQPIIISETYIYDTKTLTITQYNQRRFYFEIRLGYEITKTNFNIKLSNVEYNM